MVGAKATATPSVDGAAVDSKDIINRAENTLSRIDITVKCGQLVAIVGPVGSGKSSLLHSLLGDLHLFDADESSGDTATAAAAAAAAAATATTTAVSAQTESSVPASQSLESLSGLLEVRNEVAPRIVLFYIVLYCTIL